MSISVLKTSPRRPTPPLPGSAELARILAEIGKDASRRDAERLHPEGAVAAIKEARLGALRLPGELGGGGVTLRGLFEFVIALGAADPNVAHILRNHFTFVERFVRPSGVRSKWFQPVLEGRVFGLGSTELGATAVGGTDFATRLEPRDGGYWLDGAKYYSTGSLYADYVLIRAQDSARRFASAIFPVDRDGLELVDDWDGIGQRLTGTGTTLLRRVPLTSDEVVFDEGSPAFTRPYHSTLPQLFLTGILAGILRGLVDESVALLKRRERSFSFAPAARPVDDPILQVTVGEIASAAFAAEATVLAAADALDHVVESTGADGNVDAGLAEAGALAAAKAKVVVDDAALRAGSKLFDVGGASAARQSHNLDRHWRNARTLASHNPSAYKARAVGQHAINGTPPPQSGFF